MENFVIIAKDEHTSVYILKPTLNIAVYNQRAGMITVEISDDDEMGDTVFISIDSGEFQGRFIEYYDEEIQKKILDSIETAIARDIAHFAGLGYTYIGTSRSLGEDPSECFFLEDHKQQWQKDYRCILELYQQEYIKQNLNKQK